MTEDLRRPKMKHAEIRGADGTDVWRSRGAMICSNGHIPEMQSSTTICGELFFPFQLMF